MDVLENQVVTKKDDNTIQVVKSVPVQFDFTPEYLKQQIINIQAQKDRDNVQRDLEIAECEAYLAECVKLEVVEKIEVKPVEETPVEIKPVEPVEETPTEEIKL